MALVRKNTIVNQIPLALTGKKLKRENIGEYDAEEFITALTKANRAGYTFTNDQFNALIGAIRRGDVSKNADGSWTILNDSSLVNQRASGSGHDVEDGHEGETTGWGYETYNRVKDKNHGIFTSKGTRHRRLLDSELGDLFAMADFVMGGLLTVEAKAKLEEEKAKAEAEAKEKGRKNYDGKEYLNSIMSSYYGGSSNWKSLLQEEKDKNKQYKTLAQAIQAAIPGAEAYYNDENRKWDLTRFSDKDSFINSLRALYDELNNGPKGEDSALWAQMGFDSLNALLGTAVAGGGTGGGTGAGTGGRKSLDDRIKERVKELRDSGNYDALDDEQLLKMATNEIKGKDDAAQAEYLRSQEFEPYYTSMKPANTLWTFNPGGFHIAEGIVELPGTTDALRSFTNYPIEAARAAGIALYLNGLKPDFLDYVDNSTAINPVTGISENYTGFTLKPNSLDGPTNLKSLKALYGWAILQHENTESPYVVNRGASWQYGTYILPHTLDANDYSVIAYTPIYNRLEKIKAPDYFKDTLYNYWKSKKTVPTNKEGGILKALYGLKVNDKAFDDYMLNLQAEARAKLEAGKAYAPKRPLTITGLDTRTEEQKTAGLKEIGTPWNRAKTDATTLDPALFVELSNQDIWQLTNVAGDVASAIAALIPGYGTVASGVIGLGSSTSQLALDLTSDSQNGFSAFGNFILNAGMDVVGLLPYLGAGAKALKIAKTLGKSKGILRAITAYAAYNNMPEFLQATQKLLSDSSKMTVDDWRAFGGGINLMAGAYSSHHNYNQLKKMMKPDGGTVKTSTGGSVELTQAELETISNAGKNKTKRSEILADQNEAFKNILKLKALAQGIELKDDQLQELANPFNERSFVPFGRREWHPFGENPADINYTYTLKELDPNASWFTRHFNDEYVMRNRMLDGVVSLRTTETLSTVAPKLSFRDVNGKVLLPEGLIENDIITVGNRRGKVAGFNQGRPVVEFEDGSRTIYGTGKAPMQTTTTTTTTTTPSNKFKLNDEVEFNSGTKGKVVKVNSDGSYEVEINKAGGGTAIVEDARIGDDIKAPTAPKASTPTAKVDDLLKNAGVKAESTLEANAEKLAEHLATLKEEDFFALTREQLLEVQNKLGLNNNQLTAIVNAANAKRNGGSGAIDMELFNRPIETSYISAELAAARRNWENENTNRESSQHREDRIALEKKEEEARANHRKEVKARARERAVRSSINKSIDWVRNLLPGLKKTMAQASAEAMTPPSREVVPTFDVYGTPGHRTKALAKTLGNDLYVAYKKILPGVSKKGLIVMFDRGEITLERRGGSLNFARLALLRSGGRMVPKADDGLKVYGLYSKKTKQALLFNDEGKFNAAKLNTAGSEDEWEVLNEEYAKKLLAANPNYKFDDPVTAKYTAKDSAWEGWEGAERGVNGKMAGLPSRYGVGSSATYDTDTNQLINKDGHYNPTNVSVFSTMLQYAALDGTLLSDTKNYISKGEGLTNAEAERKHYNDAVQALRNYSTNVSNETYSNKAKDATATHNKLHHDVYAGWNGLNLLGYDLLLEGKNGPTTYHRMALSYENEFSKDLDPSEFLARVYQHANGTDYSYYDENGLLRALDGDLLNHYKNLTREADSYLSLEGDEYADLFRENGNGNADSRSVSSVSSDLLTPEYKKLNRGSNIRWDNVIGLTRVPFLNHNNTVAANKAKDWDPALKLQLHRIELIEGDYQALREAQEGRSRLESNASKPFTSNASLLLAGQLTATDKGNQLQMTAAEKDALKFYETRHKVVDLANQDLVYNTQVGDYNRGVLAEKDKFDSQIDSELTIKNANNWDNWAMGIQQQLANGYDRQWQFSLQQGQLAYASLLDSIELQYYLRAKAIEAEHKEGGKYAKNEDYQEALTELEQWKLSAYDKAQKMYGTTYREMVGPHIFTNSNPTPSQRSTGLYVDKDGRQYTYSLDVTTKEWKPVLWDGKAPLFDSKGNPVSGTPTYRQPQIKGGISIGDVTKAGKSINTTPAITDEVRSAITTNGFYLDANGNKWELDTEGRNLIPYVDLEKLALLNKYGGILARVEAKKAKKGSSLTANLKYILESSKDFNRALRDNMKEFHRNIRAKNKRRN